MSAQGQGNGTFTLRSNDLGGQFTMIHVANVFGCSGSNQSPHLMWENAPDGTKSFAITMYDSDAPTGSGWWHWVAVDIPATITELVAGAGVTGAEGMLQIKNDYGFAGYGGPCPPEGHGFHTYMITVHALDVESLGIDDSVMAPVAGFNIGAHTIAKASIVAYYKR
ncbi:MAG: YbhB/YbcL family Raf kinase inhibitor-like protein [Bacteroidia bacterium]|nr:YbhB/YbcL family Raf kinase inhibitor-like protein [Bacteroidia bacterium]